MSHKLNVLYGTFFLNFTLVTKEKVYKSISHELVNAMYSPRLAANVNARLNREKVS